MWIVFLPISFFHVRSSHPLCHTQCYLLIFRAFEQKFIFRRHKNKQKISRNNTKFKDKKIEKKTQECPFYQPEDIAVAISPLHPVHHRQLEPIDLTTHPSHHRMPRRLKTLLRRLRAIITGSRPTVRLIDHPTRAESQPAPAQRAPIVLGMTTMTVTKPSHIRAVRCHRESA